jgi:hypothetical protein
MAKELKDNGRSFDATGQEMGGYYILLVLAKPETEHESLLRNRGLCYPKRSLNSENS